LVVFVCRSACHRLSSSPGRSGERSVRSSGESSPGDERVAGAGRDIDVDDLTGTTDVEGKQHVLKVQGAAQHAIAPLGGATEQDLLARTDATIVRRTGVAFLQRDDLLQATRLDLAGHVVLELARGVGDAAVAVAEHEG